MDGRLRKRLAAGLAAAGLATAGCKSTSNTPTLPNATLPMAGQAKAGWFGSSPAPKFAAPPADPVPVREARKKGQPFKAETLIAVGDAELEAAFDDGRAGADRDQILDAVRQRYSAALQQDPKNKDALLGLAKMYTWAGDKERALHALNNLTAAHPKDKDAAFAVVKTMVRFQDWDGACKACTAALALDPENRTYTKSLGYAHARADRWDDSFATLMKIMSESEARAFLGRTLIDLGRPADGTQQLQMAVQRDPNNEMAKAVLADLQQAAAGAAVEQTGYTGQ